MQTITRLRASVAPCGTVLIDRETLPPTQEARLKLVKFWQRSDRKFPGDFPLERDHIEKARRLDVLTSTMLTAWSALQGVSDLIGAVGTVTEEKKPAARAEARLAVAAAMPSVEAALAARYALREYNNVRVPHPDSCVYFHAERRHHPELFPLTGVPSSSGLNTILLTAVDILDQFAMQLDTQTQYGDWLADDWRSILRAIG